MSSNLRYGALGRTSMRPPRASAPRSHAATVARSDRFRPASPADSLASTSTGTKRKERDYESDTAAAAAVGGLEDTNINVVVRCRGRNEREIRENSAVVVETDGSRGKLVQLSMGPSAMSNKTYSFDRVFSPAADQSMVFDDVVKPILDEMLAGFNCTIFAYGQTGTGKTYTMSGDMSETMGLLSDEAGIIPRVLHALFNQLQIEGTESCVKCSFIELYNEELRDLISVEETARLKIYDDTTRRGHASTVVQGMEEKHIKTAAEGVKILQDGSLKRRVAATRCNDLSSRSHTVFTVTTAYVKRNADGTDDLVATGKLNLVDLAGSENIQRSGAENKRAAEAGLINKSLLTLGRVINALVDHSQHIPYRESKLTRLLQDSLGGRTKTCIIATVCPAKSNLEETISTLDYAFRAKNIRNKPQINLLTTKHTLLQDFTNEIERLKSELITTRQRNGVYLSNDAYEELSADRESRRIVMEELSAKIETLETNLRNKVHELFELTSTFMGLKKDHDGTKARLDDARAVLDQTELVLAATRRGLAEETHLRRAHQETEARLGEMGGELIAELQRTVHDVGGLQAKNRRRSELHGLNRTVWIECRDDVAEVTAAIERHLRELLRGQERTLAGVSQRVETFVADELVRLSATQRLADEHLDDFSDAWRQLDEQQQRTHEELDGALDEIGDVRDTVKRRIGDGLQAMTGAAERIAAGVAAELLTLQDQLHASYSVLGRDLRTVFGSLIQQMTAQREESDGLRRELEAATAAAATRNGEMADSLYHGLEEERKLAAEERDGLVDRIAALIAAQAEQHESRLTGRAALLQRDLQESGSRLRGAAGEFGRGMDTWDAQQGNVLHEAEHARDRLESKIEKDLKALNAHGVTIRETAQSVHSETVRLVDDQVRDLDGQMQDLDDFVTRARAANAHNTATHADKLASMASAVKGTTAGMAAYVGTSTELSRTLGDAVAADSQAMADGMAPVEAQVWAPLAALREHMAASAPREYEPTGETPAPARMAYNVPRVGDLPRTAPHDALLAGMTSPKATPSRSTGIPAVFVDNEGDGGIEEEESVSLSLSSSRARIRTLPTASADRRSQRHSTATGVAVGLREVNPNLAQSFDPGASTVSLPGGDGTATVTGSLFRRSFRGPPTKAGAGGRKTVIGGGGVENVTPAVAAGSRRKSPRLN